MNPLLVGAMLLGASSVGVAAAAQELRPDQGYSVHLGAVSGSVYTTETSAGSRVVATLGSGPGATPVRFVTDLKRGQSLIVSVPRGPGETALEVMFTRQGDRVVVTDAE